MHSSAPGRLSHVDGFKAVASQLIVLHHLAFYGPMSDAAAEWAPALFHWLSQHARMAVQVFLVLGGYLAARSLAPQGRWTPGRSASSSLLERYVRLVLPYTVVLALAVGAAALADAVMDHDVIPSAPELLQILAHLLLLQDVLKLDALSAGIWYVAIDMQLFALLVLVLVASRELEQRLQLQGPVAPYAVAALVLGSLWVFNRDAEWDAWAPYFFGAYGLGVLVAWWPAQRRHALRWGLLAAAAWAALVMDFRWRIAVACSVTAWLLLVSPLLGSASPAVSSSWQRGVAWLSSISYAVFLIHFPVFLVVNAVFTAFVPATPPWQGLGILTAWACSVWAGAAFHAWVERPVLALVTRWRGVRGRQAVRTGTAV